MRILFILLTILVLAKGCFGQSYFLDRVLTYDDCRYCYFLVVNFESRAYSGKIIVENDKLQDFLKQTNRLKRDKYADFMKDILHNKRSLLIKRAYLDKSGLFLNVKKISKLQFRVVKTFGRTEKIANKGCIAFIRYYFLGEELADFLDKTDESDCKMFIKAQSQNLILSRKISGLVEENAIIEKLFGWQIPVITESYSGLLSIEISDIKNMTNKQ